MNNKEFIAELSQRTGYTQENTRQIVRKLIDGMMAAFDDGQSVQIAGFGTFEVKKRLERVMVNPSTGQKMMVPPKLVLSFKASPVIKEELKKGGEADE